MGLEMIETVLRLAVSAGLGVVLGTFFFGALWLTLRRLNATSHPHWLLFASFVGRAAVVLGAFYLLARHGPGMILAAAAGFVVSRALLVRHLGRERRRPVERAPQ